MAMSSGPDRHDLSTADPETSTVSTVTSDNLDYCWVVLAVGTLAIFGALGLGRFGYTVVLPSMQQGLGMDNTLAGAMASMNLAGYLALSALGGALASSFGPRRVITAGLVLAGLGMFFTGMSESFITAAFWRVLTGFGSGAANVAVMGMWGAWFPIKRRGLAAGIAVTGSSLGLIFTGLLVPQILSSGIANAWRVCWYIYGAATLIIAMVAMLLIRSHHSTTGATRGNYKSGRQPTVAGIPALQWGLVYRSPQVWRLGLVYVAFGFSYIIYMTFFVKRLMAEGGYSREAAGGLFMTMGWASLLCGLIWGGISDLIGRRYALAIVYLLHTAAFALFALLPTTAGFTISAVMFGLSAWSIPAIMAATCGDMVGPRLSPAALGFITLFFGIGQAIAPSVAGAMADNFGSFAPAFLLAALVAFSGALGSMLLRPVAAAKE
jgi:MFS family permease